MKTVSRSESNRRWYDKKLAREGRIRKADRKFSIDHIRARFYALVDKNGPIVSDDLGPCWLWTGSRAPNGYPKFSFMGTSRYAHRVSWFLEHGEMPLCACHRCDNGNIGCVRPSHLFNGSAKDNSRDSISKGRFARPGSKLTTESVAAMRALRPETTYQKIADLFGVHITVAWKACNRVTWKAVK